MEEAARRGLPNLPTMLDAVDTLTTEKSIRLFEKFGIFTKAELESRKEILYETYSKTLNIEANCLREIIKRQIIPAEISYMNELAETYNNGTKAGVEIKSAKEILEKVNSYCNSLSESIAKLEVDLKEVRTIKNNKERAFAYRDRIKERMEEARFYSDELERITDKDFWPIPSYGDLLFEV